MELPVSLQTVQLVLSIVLGIGLGIYYDLLRAVRERLRFLTHLLDFLFCFGTLIAALLFALYAGFGEFRLFFFVGIGGGLILWFLTLSHPFRWVLRKILRLILTPIRLLWHFLKKICKKIKEIAKNVFSTAQKWFMIK